MATTISNGTDTLTPELVDGWEAAREGRTLLHTILGSNSPAVTLRASAPRTGTLRIVVGTDPSLAADIEAMLSAGSLLTLASTERAAVNMTFVVSGEVTTSLDGDTRSVWLIEAEFQEVA